MKKNILEILNLSFSYNRDKENINCKSLLILDNLSFTFKNDKIYVITGANGSGKTTFFNIISGLSKIREIKKGKEQRSFILYEKLNLNDYKYELDSVAYFPQNFENTFFNDNIEKEIKFTLKNCNTNLNYRDIKEIYEFFEYNFDNIERKSPFDLNYGDQKLLAFFLSIIKNHQILLLDEIDSAFSIFMKKKIILFIKTFYREKINKNSIIIVISHNDYFIKEISDVVLDFNNFNRTKNKDKKF